MPNDPRGVPAEARTATLIANAAVAVGYVLAAHAGFAMSFVDGNVTLVWPASGLALTCILAYGPRIVPGLVLGAATANMTTGAPLWFCAATGIGNPLEAALIYALLLRFAHSDVRLDHSSDVFSLVGFSLVGAMAAATVGATALCSTGMAPWETFSVNWYHWWMGDFIGIVVVTPLLVALRQADPPANLVEAGAWLLSLLAVCWVVFVDGLGIGSTRYSLEFLIFPWLIWAGFRLGHLGATVSTVVVASATVWGLRQGMGPFARDNLSLSLFLFSIYTTVIAVTALFLSSLIAERKRVQRALESSNRELEAFCYAVSHDLRAPLRHVNGFADAMLEDYADEVDELGKDLLARMKGASNKMGRLIDDLLKLSRIGRADMVPNTVNLTDIADEVAHDLLERAPDRVVTWNIARDLSTTGDAALLRVGLTNLMENAWKYSKEKPESTIEVGQLPGQVFFVRDNGAGFDMTYADKLFAPFQRLHSSGRFEGTGIGLATVHRVVQRHGGRIWAEGKVDEGACFYFTLCDDPRDWHQRGDTSIPKPARRV